MKFLKFNLMNMCLAVFVVVFATAMVYPKVRSAHHDEARSQAVASLLEATNRAKAHYEKRLSYETFKEKFVLDNYIVTQVTTPDSFAFTAIPVNGMENDRCGELSVRTSEWHTQYFAKQTDCWN